MFDEVLVKGLSEVGDTASRAVDQGSREKAGMSWSRIRDPESQEWIRQNAKDLAAVMVERFKAVSESSAGRVPQAIRQITQEATPA